jgi:N-methylhydantoinase A
MTLRIGIDIGGTFTDLVAIGEDGSVRTCKTASTPTDYSIGIIDGLQALLRAAGPTAIASEVLHATTIGSNTILEGKGAPTALITTSGFRDVLEIRDLRMPRLYDIGWTKPVPLVPRHLRLEVNEKTRPDGSIAIPIDPISVATAIRSIREAGVQSVAVCLLHSYANPTHEKVVAGALKAMVPDLAFSLSHEILPEIGEYPRTSTTVINATLQPVVRAYLRSLQARLESMGIPAQLRLMQSNGGLASAKSAAETPARIVESGPAAGVVGAAVLATRLGARSIITFDMGGTTAKAGLIEDGQVSRSAALEIGAGVLAGARLLVGGGYLLKLPAIDLAEVGAGGGSLCRLDAAGAPKVGPESAGAAPGPVCYGRGGTIPTITDCNLVLGYLDPAGLAGGAIRLDADAARAAIARDLAGPMNLSLEAAAQGMLRIASATMMRAIRAVTIERGTDARSSTMMAFGGNGPLFAASLARELGIANVIIPPMPGLFSAFGLLLAETEHHLSRSLRGRVDQLKPAALQKTLDDLLVEGDQRLAQDGFGASQRQAGITAMARYVGQSSEIAVAIAPGTPEQILAALPAAFRAEHQRLYGFQAPEGEPIELMAIGLLARGISEHARLPGRVPPARAAAPFTRKAWFEGPGWVDTAILGRAAIPETGVQGPAIIQEYDSTCLVPPGARASVDDFGNIRLDL